MPTYIAITFSPVQGFIEKSRKLRDLFGSSLILSHLSKKLVDAALSENCQVISPGLPKIAEGMPNRILIEGEFSEEKARNTLKTAWKEILAECKQWIENHLPETNPDSFYHWQRDWEMWGTHTWEIFWGEGETIEAAIKDLETRKLSRDWTGINWIGESSSITGTDAIAWNGLGKGTRNPKTMSYRDEGRDVQRFYDRLAEILNTAPKGSEEDSEGRFLDPSERLSILELVKRLVTRYDIAQRIGITPLDKSFTDLDREQWTGWFMGDGDKVGDHLKTLVQSENSDTQIKEFSNAMRNWGMQFKTKFPSNLGRVVYAGGDDFLGVIYSKNPKKTIEPSDAFNWLKGLNSQWHSHQQPINLSVGFVWAASKVPQRDVLQHCREAEKVAKNSGRDRVTIRIVFRSGQFIQWTCPWVNLNILSQYTDQEGETNWNHLYSDLAQLKARHAFNDVQVAIALMNIYFNRQGDTISHNRKDWVGDVTDDRLIEWIDNLIQVGWWLLH